MNVETNEAPHKTAVEPAPEAPEALPAKRKRPSKRTLGILAAVLVVLAGGWWFMHRGIEHTDNAQVDADIVAVPARVPGTVAQVLFTENQPVKEGDLLVLLDEAPARAKVAQAEAALAAATAAADGAEVDARLAESKATTGQSSANASLAAASSGAASASGQIAEAEANVTASEANLQQAQQELDRQQKLLASGATAQAAFDRAQTNFDVAKSNLALAKARLASLQSQAAAARSKVAEASAQAQYSGKVDEQVALAQAKARAARAQADAAAAALDQARLELSWCRILAPHDGVVSRKTATEGQAISAGQSVVQLVTPQIWVTGNFKETQVGDMRVGQPAFVEVDAFPGVDIEGEVESFAGATGSRFALLPPDNATGNFTKVVQRVPVRIKLHQLPNGVSLRPGMSVELRVDTRG